GGRRAGRGAVRRAGDGPEELRAEDGVLRVGEAEAHLRRGDRARVVRGDQAGEALREPAAILGAERLRELAGVDRDRARGGAQAVRGAGVEALVLEVVLDAREALRIGAGVAQARDLALQRDALPRRERERARGALRLAEAALDALVDEVVRRRQGL